MNTRDLRREIKRRIDCLSVENLKLFGCALTVLEGRESIEATEELLAIPGFAAVMAEAERDIKAGRTVPVAELRKKY